MVLVSLGCSENNSGTCDPLRDALCTLGDNTDSSIRRRDGSTSSNPDGSVVQRDGSVSKPDATINRDGTVVSNPDATIDPDAMVDGDGMVVEACGQILPRPVGPGPCTAATRSCVDGCADATCITNCLKATPGCEECVDEAATFCPARNGCEAETKNFLCCIEEDCAGAQDLAACVQATCPTVPTAYEVCLETTAVTNACGNLYGAEYAGCFQTSGADGSVPDATAGDASVPDGGIRECAEPLEPVPANLHTFCEAKTRTCIAAASTEQEYDDCLTADNAAPYVNGANSYDCSWCIGYTQNSCGSNNGCGSQFADMFCCIEDNNCTDSACVTANCSAEASAVNTCYTTLGAACSINSAAYDPCF